MNFVTGSLVRTTQILFVAAILLGWWALSAASAISPILLPPIDKAASSLWSLLVSGDFLPALQITLTEYVLAFAISASVALSIGLAISRTNYRVRVFEPFFAGLYSVPMVLLFPMFVLMFGIGIGSKIALGIAVSFFPIVLSAIAGFSAVNPVYLRSAASMGATSGQLAFSVMLPAAFPVVLSGLRVGMVVSFLAVIGGETLAAFDGLGHQIVALSESMETDRMFAYVGIVITVAAVANWAATRIERWGWERFGNA